MRNTVTKTTLEPDLNYKLDLIRISQRKVFSWAKSMA